MSSEKNSSARRGRRIKSTKGTKSRSTKTPAGKKGKKDIETTETTVHLGLLEARAGEVATIVLENFIDVVDNNSEANLGIQLTDLFNSDTFSKVGKSDSATKEAAQASLEQIKFGVTAAIESLAESQEYINLSDQDKGVVNAAVVDLQAQIELLNNSVNF